MRDFEDSLLLIIYMPHIHWVPRGTGIPKDRDEVNRREVCECDEVNRREVCECVMGEWVLKIYYVYYESIKREPKIRGIYECRCDERLQTKTKKFTRLPYTGLVLELEHLKIETRLISERFANAMGEWRLKASVVYYESMKRKLI